MKCLFFGCLSNWTHLLFFLFLSFSRRSLPEQNRLKWLFSDICFNLIKALVFKITSNILEGNYYNGGHLQPLFPPGFHSNRWVNTHSSVYLMCLFHIAIKLRSFCSFHVNVIVHYDLCHQWLTLFLVLGFLIFSAACCRFDFALCAGETALYLILCLCM